MQPTSATAGVAISPAVTVRVVDRFGNLETGDHSMVTVGIATNVGGGTLSGTLTQPAVGGIATFSDLSINKTGLGYDLSACDPGLGGGTSSFFNITRRRPRRSPSTCSRPRPSPAVPSAPPSSACWTASATS